MHQPRRALGALEIDPWEGIGFGCTECPAGADEILPDGFDLLAGEFEVYPGYALCLDAGRVLVNDADYGGLHMYGWRGPVTASVRTERADYLGGHKYDFFIDLKAA